MKSVFLAIGLLVAPLSACSTLPKPTASSVTLVDDKALYGAETAFRGLLIAVNTAQDAHLLTGDKSAAASKAVQRAYDALLIARRTKSVADVLAATQIANSLKESIR